MSDKQSYFSPTPTSTPSTSPPSTPDVDEVKVNTDDLKKDPNQHLPALMRDFPQPEGDIDIGEALARQPGRWTIAGQMEANRARSQQQGIRQNNTAITAKLDLDAIKAKLLQSHQKMQSR
ncbi:unnamed protein product [Clonostachys rosea]|uniref:Uncharacterized protein n=1 Tax=Bionectria ochroleuca TaxID=29856 RepID=A0ABY6V2V6_BIOOC|nr:unnamed protein product [Clonostachys rosea]